MTRRIVIGILACAALSFGAPLLLQQETQAAPARAVLTDARWQEIFRLQDALRRNARNSDAKEELIQVAWDETAQVVTVIGVGARGQRLPMQRRAAAADCARWVAYHQAWKQGSQQDFGRVAAQVTGSFSNVTEGVLPDGRLVIVRQYRLPS